MVSKYDFQYTDQGPYGATLRLLAGANLHGRVVIDVGCGSAAIAEHVRALEATYIGLDLDETAVAELTGRGYEGHTVDITSPELSQAIKDIIGARQVAALVCLDVLEHVTEPQAVLARLTQAVSAQEDVELVVSIPNVAHIDIARKLLCGRWDMTDSGLLDRTHLRFFTDATITAMMSRAGWHESAREDFHLIPSDQNWRGHPAFTTDTSLGRLLFETRSRTDQFGDVNQFVRRYHRGAAREPQIESTEGPFLSVVVRTMGTREETLEDVLCCLAAQTDLDFEIVLVVHDVARVDEVRNVVDRFDGNLAQRVRLYGCSGGERGRPANLGLQRAKGEYVAYLDDDDLVTGDWVQRFREGAQANRGMVIRGWAAEQHREWARSDELAPHKALRPLTPTYNTEFDLVRHIRQNETPFHCFAFPRSLVELGFQFDERVTVCEDWEFLVRAASVCGVHDTKRMTSIYNRWSDKSSAQAVARDEWNSMRALIHVELDRQPLLLPPGSVRTLDRVLERGEEDVRRIAQLEADLAAANARTAEHAEVSYNAHAALEELRHSTSWRAGAPLRGIGMAARRVRNRLNR